MTMIATADLCDVHSDKLSIVAPMFLAYGGRADFFGQIRTLKVYEDNALVRQTLSAPGNGNVLVVDGGGSLRCALVGDQLALLAVQNNWTGVIVYGCVRDSVAMKSMDVGIRALNTHPLRSLRKGIGESDIPVSFGGVKFTPGQWLYSDADGIVVSSEALTLG
jgi:regulator of ribonuclease activity A